MFQNNYDEAKSKLLNSSTGEQRQKKEKDKSKLYINYILIIIKKIKKIFTMAMIY